VAENLRKDKDVLGALEQSEQVQDQEQDQDQDQDRVLGALEQSEKELEKEKEVENLKEKEEEVAVHDIVSVESEKLPEGVAVAGGRLFG